MQVIDFHAHIYPQEVAVKATDEGMFPVWDPSIEMAAFDRLPLLAQEREKILGGNAAKILQSIELCRSERLHIQESYYL